MLSSHFCKGNGEQMASNMNTSAEEFMPQVNQVQ